MLENGVFNRPYVRDITKICECACSMNCDKNATELRPDRNPDIITNADRIRAMSDEELAVFLESSRGCPSDDDCEYGVHATPENCIKHWTTWLQQPAEEDA